MNKALILALLVACKDDSKSDDTSGTDDTAGSDTDTNSDAVCTDPVEPACIDDMILDLSLHEEVSSGDVTTTTDGDDFVTVVDATAGGYNTASNRPWVYVKFTTEGAERVDIDDESALESMDWDLSLRRYLVRMNGGDGGPSCVGMSKQSGSYADITSVPEGTTYELEDFYSDSCVMDEDPNFPGSPDLALGDWWSYGSCVATTMQPFLIQLADGHVMKLVIEAYYAEGQEDCNSGGSASGESGVITMRWQMLQ